MSETEMFHLKLDRILLTMQNARATQRAAVPLTYFREVELWSSDQLDFNYNDLNNYGPLASMSAMHDVSVTPRDLDRPLDVSLLVNRRGADGEIVAGLGLSRFRQVAPHIGRGERKRVFPVTIQWTNADVSVDQSYEAWQTYWGWTGHGWVSATDGRRAPDGHVVEYAYQRAFARRYDWFVSLGYVDTPAVLLATDPIGAREVFKLRDLPEGATRRTALRHWVEQHWRKRRSDPSVETSVRAHFRGVTSFVWNGLRCTVHPSEYLQDKAAAQ